MHIGTAWMTSPDGRFLSVRAGLQAVMLLNTQISNGMTCLPQCAQQLWLRIQQGLSPLGVLGTDCQDSTFERQRTAMGRQSLARNRWPVLPQTGQVAVAIPGLTKMVQAGSQR